MTTNGPPGISLQTLDRLLAHLSVGEQVMIDRAAYDRIFGTNDVASRRLLHFGKGHGCDAAVLDHAVVFTKRSKVGA
ncbi:hypothetical protein M446_2871 [Methylobacterium sp. 4-46]|uniref:hypothetical protein n=1 Tax=unclassified Methylobacterium TaxID=2615210 RepID=UPI000165C9D7|nr:MULTISPECIES: hypothetical protein [Methylobacterium]ACA17293.1 hypothetical protein M446_2871 [Methylobacterium sp. 4-46]WFT82980.1 hypothetical protein QA634_14565 [Methylobacterium nodulans]